MPSIYSRFSISRRRTTNLVSPDCNNSSDGQVQTKTIASDQFQRALAVKTAAPLISLTAAAVASRSYAAAPKANPDPNTEDVKANYGVINGELFIKGAGDGCDIDPNDVKQGELGDCYLMSSLATLAQNDPDAIRNMIRDNHDGTYTVTLYEKRPWWKPWAPEFRKKEYTVTPDIPVDGSGNTVYAHTGDTAGSKKELWVCLIEKAYAQAEGSYSEIEGGVGDEAMERLTGRPSACVDPEDMSLDDIAEVLDGDHGLTCSSLLEVDASEVQTYKDKKLDPEHSYWIDSVDKKNGTITLGNPHGFKVTLTLDEFRKSFRRISIGNAAHGFKNKELLFRLRQVGRAIVTGYHWTKQKVIKLCKWVGQKAEQFGGWVGQKADQFGGWVDKTVTNFGNAIEQTANKAWNIVKKY